MTKKAQRCEVNDGSPKRPTWFIVSWPDFRRLCKHSVRHASGGKAKRVERYCTSGGCRFILCRQKNCPLIPEDILMRY